MEKNSKFYLYMDYLKFLYHPLNLNKSKKKTRDKLDKHDKLHKLIIVITKYMQSVV